MMRFALVKPKVLKCDDKKQVNSSQPSPHGLKVAAMVSRPGPRLGELLGLLCVLLLVLVVVVQGLMRDSMS